MSVQPEQPESQSGSSVPANVRNAFLDLINDETEGEAACRLVAQVSQCTDPLPVEYCHILDLPDGSTFADAARTLGRTLGCQDVG
jgi:hypothetical protein